MSLPIVVKVGKVTINKVNSAIHDLKWKARETRELSNRLENGQAVESESCFTVLFSGQDSPLSVEAENFLNDLCKKYGELTPANYARFIAEIQAKTTDIAARIPVVDKRKTLEELKAQNEKYQTARAIENKEQAERAELKKRFKPGNRLIVAAKCVNNSDMMSDYYDPCREVEAYILRELPEGKRDLNILKAEIAQYPSLNGLTWEEHRDSYSMNHYGYSLTSGPAGKVKFTPYNSNATECTFFWKVDFGYIDYDGHHPFFPEERKVPAHTESVTAENLSGVQVRHNTEKNGVEIVFPAKPSVQMLGTLKANGWRWSPYNQLWYNRYSPERMEEARRITGVTTAPAPIISIPATG